MIDATDPPATRTSVTGLREGDKRDDKERQKKGVKAGVTRSKNPERRKERDSIQESSWSPILANAATATHALLDNIEPRRSDFFQWVNMNTISLHEAQAHLSELVHGLAPGQVPTITENDWPVARLVQVPIIRHRPPRPRPPVTGVPRAGQYEGRLVVPNDFKEPLEDLREYIQVIKVD
jgi:antitoxin (DNA-binding transcriptional repressor) of toxin-antitoxin stability system